MTDLNEFATWLALEKILANVPKLGDTACSTSMAHLFDPYAPRDETKDKAEARHHRALNLCRACPALDACGEWALSERDHGGVIAGRSGLIP